MRAGIQRKTLGFHEVTPDHYRYLVFGVEK